MCKKWKKDKKKNGLFLHIFVRAIAVFHSWTNPYSSYLKLMERTTNVSAVSWYRLRPMETSQIKNVHQFHFYPMIRHHRLFLRFANPWFLIFLLSFLSLFPFFLFPHSQDSNSHFGWLILYIYFSIITQHFRTCLLALKCLCHADCIHKPNQWRAQLWILWSRFLWFLILLWCCLVVYVVVVYFNGVGTWSWNDHSI